MEKAMDDFLSDNALFLKDYFSPVEVGIFEVVDILY